MSTQVSIEPRQSVPRSVYVLGVRVDRLSQVQAVQQIITVNPEFVVAAQQNADFRQAINAAALVVADGSGVVWATRYLRAPAPERVTGVDTLPDLARSCARAGYSLYLLGAAPSVAEEAA